MRYYFAPMEGLTDSIYRKLHNKYFPGITQYYTPFLSPTVHRCLTPKERKELPPADTLDYCVIPQILTKNSDDFLWLAQQCSDLGYKEVNLNLGCPSGTVTAKGKGSGMLTDPDGLDRFLEAIYASAPLSISIKTRLGFTAPEEFPTLLDIFNRYPICELIIHPRVRCDFYKGSINMDMFHYANKHSCIPLCFNGNLCNAADIQQLKQQFPDLPAVMLGRGLIADPGMLCPGGTKRSSLAQFHNELLSDYTNTFGGTRNAMFRMKEHWSYLIRLFVGGESLYKRLRKTTDLGEYMAITQEIFETLLLQDALIPDW